MHFVVKYFPEITIKTPPVRKRFTRQLARNLSQRLKVIDKRVDIDRAWDRLTINIAEATEQEVVAVSRILATTPGIAYFACANLFKFEGLEDLAAEAANRWRDLDLKGTFCVRTKRSGQHPFNSTDIERAVGAAVLQQKPELKVNLTQPDTTLRLEVAHQQCFVVQQQQRGLGGFPLGTQDEVLSLVSGGFDSTVASYLTCKRGLITHFLFFNLGGPAHELGAKEVSYFLWRKYGSSHPVKFISVPFEQIVQAILQHVHNTQMGVVLKRMMLRVADKVAKDLGIQALVTGESVAQVASQTLKNLAVIDRACDTLVLRPLITMDKGDIINLSRQIGTEDFSAQMPEYCGVISVKPTTRASEDRVAREEQQLPIELVDDAFARRRVQSITDLQRGLDVDLSVSKVSELPPGVVVVDIRHPTEAENSPLQLSGTIIKAIPFYRLSEQFSALNQSCQYFLYCDQGVMSQLHAAQLKEAGFSNIGVYRPQ